MKREDPFLTCNEEVHAVVYDPERAEPVCSKCGLVLEEMKLDFVMESFAVRKIRVSCRRARTAPKGSSRRLSIEIGLRDFLSKKSIPKAVRDKSLELCQVVCKKRLRRGYSVSTLSSALVYAAHRVCLVPTTLAECATASMTEKRKVARCYDRLCRELELKVPRFARTDYLPHLARKVRINEDTIALASEILERVKNRRLNEGANPIGIAASALYVASGMTGKRISQKVLASAAGVSEVTVRTNCKTIHGFLRTLTFP